MTEPNNYNRYRFPQLDRGSSGNRSPGDHIDLTADGAMTANDELGALQNEAYESGFVQGRDQMLQSEKASFTVMGDLLRQAKEELVKHQSHIRHACREDAVRLAVTLARDIIRHELCQRPDLNVHIAQKAMQMGMGQGPLKIKTHPGDSQTIRTMVQDMQADANLSESIQVASDQSIQRGGCLIESDFGLIDARIEQQLTSISTALREIHTKSDAAASLETDVPSDFQRMQERVKTGVPIRAYGHVTKVVGLVVEANGPMVQLGCMCDIDVGDQTGTVAAEVLGFRDQTVLLMPLEEIRSIGPGCRVVARPEKASVTVGRQLLGRIIDGLGNPIDKKGPLSVDCQYPLYASPINPLLRQRIRTPLDMGIRAINGLHTIGCGQRMGIFAGSGVGKSVLMGMIARKSSADVNVIALIGERGRELNEFIERDLGEEGLKKSVVVVATSDHLPLVRVRGAFLATTIAEYFRDQGLNVNLMMDSLTRFAMAQREIGLALGEPPTTKGYTPSVFTLMPRLLERAGTSDHSGTITGLYTVLVEGDDMNEPVADTARSILDGHIVLSRELADQNHYPAIDVLRSISRVMEDIASLQHKHSAGRLKELLATYRKSEDLINIGAYVAGSNPTIDRAIAKIEQINAFLRQDIQESVDMETCLQQLAQIMSD